MLKMILDPMGGILLTNDGNAILREIDVAHPAAKNMIELSRTQDEECGDGTTSVIILGTSTITATFAIALYDTCPGSTDPPGMSPFNFFEHESGILSREGLVMRSAHGRSQNILVPSDFHRCINIATNSLGDTHIHVGISFCHCYSCATSRTYWFGIVTASAKMHLYLSPLLCCRGQYTDYWAFIAGEILAQSLSQLERDIHPVVIISAYNKALKEALEIIKRISIPINTNNDEEMLSLIKTSIGTKFVMRWSDLMCKLALQAIRIVAQEEGAIKTVDIKRYARVEKIPGGEIEQSKVLDGIMLNKDITHPKMRRRIVNPRIVLLDCPLEYKKGESQTNIEISQEADWARIQEIEEEQVKAMVDKIIEFKPDIVMTEKGVSGAYTLSSSLCGLLTKCIKITHNTSCTGRTSPPSDEYARRITTVSHVRSGRRLLTVWRTCVSPTLAHDAVFSTSRRSETSQFLLLLSTSSRADLVFTDTTPS